MVYTLTGCSQAIMAQPARTSFDVAWSTLSPTQRHSKWQSLEGKNGGIHPDRIVCMNLTAKKNKCEHHYILWRAFRFTRQPSQVGCRRRLCVVVEAGLADREISCAVVSWSVRFSQVLAASPGWSRVDDEETCFLSPEFQCL